MAIISISRGSFRHGKEIAERVAQKLGYTCISREVMLTASSEFNVPEIQLARAVHDTPSFWDKYTFGKEQYLAYAQCALLEYAQKDNLVYHGLGGQFILKEVEHALTVYIMADIQSSVRVEMARQGISRGEARAKLKRDDHERTQWALDLWGTDPLDPRLFDLMIHLRKITVDDAVDLICQSALSEPFKRTPESQKELDDLLLAARVRSRLVGEIRMVTVRADTGVIYVEAMAAAGDEARLLAWIEELAGGVPGAKDIRINVTASDVKK